MKVKNKNRSQDVSIGTQTSASLPTINTESLAQWLASAPKGKFAIDQPITSDHGIPLTLQEWFTIIMTAMNSGVTTGTVIGFAMHNCEDNRLPLDVLDDVDYLLPTRHAKNPR